MTIQKFIVHVKDHHSHQQYIKLLKEPLVMNTKLSHQLVIGDKLIEVLLVTKRQQLLLSAHKGLTLQEISSSSIKKTT